jgi:uncharacterized protein DUF1360
VSVPDWWETALLFAAAWRVFQLLAFDDILETPRRYVTRLGKSWKKDGDPIPKAYREKLALFLTCPYCAGFWIALAWWGAWQAWPHETLVAATPWVLSAGVVGFHKILSSE